MALFKGYGQRDPKGLTEEQRLIAQSIVLEIAFSYAVSYESQSLLYSQDRWDVVEAANLYLAKYPAFRSHAIRQLRENAFGGFADGVGTGTSKGGNV